MVDWIEKMKATGRRTTAAEASVIAAQLVSALIFGHELKIGHLDLKPGNVFIMAVFIQVVSLAMPFSLIQAGDRLVGKFYPCDYSGH